MMGSGSESLEGEGENGSGGGESLVGVRTAIERGGGLRGGGGGMRPREEGEEGSSRGAM